jgi:LmbE family N-acetylglucosaminyl deacetylase
MPATSLFLLPHQDDEFFAMPVIADELKRGHRVRCVYLTTGSNRLRANVRNAESLEALSRLGVAAEHVEFLGAAAGVPDGALHLHLAALHDTLRPLLRQVTRLVCPAWEGGHQDHDAACLLTTALAHEAGLLENTWEFSLYQGATTFGRFFSVMTQVSRAGNARRYSWSRLEGARMAAFCRRYPSQWKTWLGIAAPATLAMVGKRELWLNPADPSRVTRPPHPGRLLYERYGRTTYLDFERQTRDYTQRLLNPTVHLG